MPTSVAVGLTGLLGSAGVGAATADILAPILGDALLGAGIGAGGSALLGKDPGKGALFGGLTGGIGGAAGPVAGALGVDAGTAGYDLIGAGLGAAGGAAGGAATGGNIGISALTGGVAGGLNALLTPGAGAAPGAGATPSAPGGPAVTPLGDNAAAGVAQTPALSAPSATGGAAGGGVAASTAIQSGGLADLTAPTSSLGSGAGAISVSDLGAPGGIEGLTVTGSPVGSSAAGILGPAAATGGALGTGAALAGGDSATKGTGSGAISVSDLGGPGGVSGAPLSTPLGGAQGTVLGPQAAPGAAGAAPAQNSFSKFISHPSLDNAGNILTSNPASVIGALGLGYEALTQPKLPSESATVGAINDQAGALSKQATQLESYINNGTLPAGAMAQITQAANAAKATLKSRYAALGLSGSTSEATALAQVDQQIQGQIFQQGQTLLEEGIKESGLSADLYKAVLGETNAQNTIMSGAISNFAAAVAGGGKGISLNLGST